MDTMHVAARGGDRYEITIRGHSVRVDQPVDGGGTDEAPTPTELFVASLASCTAFYAGRFLARRGIDTAGLAVECSFGFASDRPARVGSIDIELHVPEAMPEDQLDRLRAVVEHCTVKNSLARPPAVGFRLTRTAPAVV